MATLWDFLDDKATLDLRQVVFNEVAEQLKISLTVVGPASLVAAQRKAIWKAIWLDSHDRFVEVYVEDFIQQDGSPSISKEAIIQFATRIDATSRCKPASIGLC